MNKEQKIQISKKINEVIKELGLNPFNKELTQQELEIFQDFQNIFNKVQKY